MGLEVMEMRKGAGLCLSGYKSYYLLDFPTHILEFLREDVFSTGGGLSIKAAYSCVGAAGFRPSGNHLYMCFVA